MADTSLANTVVLVESMYRIKPYGEQIKECLENGTLTKETCKCCGGILYLCRRYGGQCMEEKCYLDRRISIIRGGKHTC